MNSAYDALGALVAAVDWEATYIANESDDAEVQRRALILLKCADEARAIYNQMTKYGEDMI